MERETILALVYESKFGMGNQPQRASFQELSHEGIGNVVARDILIVHQVDAQFRAEAFVDRNGGEQLIRQERHAKDASDVAASQDAKDIGEGFGSVMGTRCKADVPVAKVVNPPIVPCTNGEDIPLILKDSLHQRTGSMQVVHFVGGDYDMYRRRGIGVRAWRRGYRKGARFLDASVPGLGLGPAGQPISKRLIHGKNRMEHNVSRFDRRANIAPNLIRAETYCTPDHSSGIRPCLWGSSI
jgi:hypothetical protein